MNKSMSKFLTVDSEPTCTQTKKCIRIFCVSNKILTKFNENSSYKSKKYVFSDVFLIKDITLITQKKGDIFTFSFEMPKKSSRGSFLLQSLVRQDYFGLSFLNILF